MYTCVNDFFITESVSGYRRVNNLVANDLSFVSRHVNDVFTTELVNILLVNEYVLCTYTCKYHV